MPGNRQIFPEYCHCFLEKKKNGENNPLLVIYFEKKKNVLTMRHYIELKNQPNVK